MLHKTISECIDVCASVHSKKREVVCFQLEGILRILKEGRNCIDMDYLVSRKSFDFAVHKLITYKSPKYSIEKQILKLASNVSYCKFFEQKRKRKIGVLENSSVTVIRLQSFTRKMGMHMCTDTTNKESINTFENMRWWYNTFNSYSYGRVDIKDLVCGSHVSSDFNIQ